MEREEAELLDLEQSEDTSNGSASEAPPADPPTASINVNEEEELLSVSSSSSPTNVGEVEEVAATTADREHGDPTPGPSRSSSNKPVRGFRTRVDENGETVFEFASDEDEGEDNDDDEIELMEEVPPPPEQNNSRNTARRPVFLEISDSDSDSSEDPDYEPRIVTESQPSMNFATEYLFNVSVGRRVTARRGRRLGGAAGTSAPRRITQPATGGSGTTGGTSTERKKKKRRRKDTWIQKKKKKHVVTVPREPKPLAPKTVIFEEFGNQLAELNNSEPSSRSANKTASRLAQARNRVKIGFSWDTELDGSDAYLPVGAIQIKPTEVDEVLNFSEPAEILEKFIGLQNIYLTACDFEDFGLLELITLADITAEDAASKPQPKLSAQDMKRPLLFKSKKLFNYSCRIDGFPLKFITPKGVGNKKFFLLMLGGCDPCTKSIRLDLLLRKSSIVGTHDLGGVPVESGKLLIDLFNYVFQVKAPLQIGFVPDELAADADTQEEDPKHNENDTDSRVNNGNTTREEDIPWFYGQIKKYHEDEVLPEPPFSLQPEIIGPTLRPYQRQAVQWMLFREGALNLSKETHKVDLASAFLDKMYVSVNAQAQPAFYNPFVGYLCWERPQLHQLPSGGILADEMGLGKTVEVICLVLLNPKPSDEEELTSVQCAEENNLDSELSSKSSKYVQKSDSECTPSESDDSDYTPRKRSRNRRSSSSNSEIDEPIPKSTKGTRGKGRTAKQSGPNEEFVRPGLRRRRNISPCTFETSKLINSSNETEEDVESQPTTSNTAPSSSHRRVYVEVPAEAESTRESATKRKATKATAQKEKKKDSQGSLYQRLKAVYEAELFGYREAGNTATARFHGTFFDTKVARVARFECLCGTYNEGRRHVVRCSDCHSSQHADCVGFTKDLQNAFARRGLEYLCPHCVSLKNPLPAKTTLIVTPATISHQWINELRRHVNKTGVSIFFYKGVSSHGYVPPAKIAQYDIVITTYNVLSDELNYVDLPHLNSEDGRRFRQPKRFMTIPSPLTCLLWWRLCLDEAQMVEGIATKMASMAMKLPSVHRWCVTGTPINDGLQDLFGLFAFLGVEPVSLDLWWEKLVQEPFRKKDTSLLYQLFGQLIWRTSKNDVLEQLGIPPQTSLVRWKTFSAVENHFYQQQYELCSRKILDKIYRLKQSNSNILETRLSNLDRQIVQTLMQPFLELRKACCHPQMVKGQSLSLQKGTMTMEELLAQLIKKTSLQCADNHRQVVAALNGMAGVHILREEWVAASEKYREVLQSAAKNKEHFTTDSLQLLHTLENLADLLDRHHDGIPYTLRDSSLQTESEELKRKYLEKYSNNVRAAKDAVEPFTKLTAELQQDFKCRRSSWWTSTLSSAARLNKIEDVVKRIKQELMDVTKKNERNFVSLANRFNDALSLEHVLVESLLQMEERRNKALEGLEKLQTENPTVFIDAAVSCHLRKKSEFYYKQSSEFGFRCQLCQYHDEFLQYESVLFKEDKKNKVIRTGRKWQQHKILGGVSNDLTEEERNLVLLREEEELVESLEHVNAVVSEELRRGTWGDSEMEKILKLINNFARVNRLSEDIRADGSTHIKLFDTLKKEFRFLRILWRQIYDQVSAHDELSQATTRMCIKQSNATGSESNEAGPSVLVGSAKRKNKKTINQLTSAIAQDQRVQNINILERHELDTKMGQLETELETGKAELSVHIGQLLYLETLKQKDYGKKGSVNSDDCPVCQNQLGQEWNVLKCGHSYCSDCVKKMCPNMLQSFLCPLCRSAMKYADVTFVDTRVDACQSSSKDTTPRRSHNVKGSHSTKVEAILETVLELQETHPGEKIIIFSNWMDVLEILARALNQNDVKNCLLNQPGKKFQTELESFKQREDIQVLLMAINAGAKGLNIIEATHVILVEPILNLASELQAIGRVHRIGQTKPTFVHRYYIKDTIEEQLFEILKTHDVSSDNEGALTVADLQSLIRDGKDYHGPNDVTIDLE